MDGKVCLNCGKEIAKTKRRDAVFCSVSCRSSHHQKGLRKQKISVKVLKGIRAFLPKYGFWVFILVALIALFPWSLKKSMQLYQEHQVKELKQLKADLDYLKTKQAVTMDLVNTLLNPESGWMKQKDIDEFIQGNRKLLNQLSQEDL